MKRKPTISVADNGNLQIHIPMLIRRMRGRKQVIAPQAPGRGNPGSRGTGSGCRRPGPGAGIFLGGNPRKRASQIDQ